MPVYLLLVFIFLIQNVSAAVEKISLEQAQKLAVAHHPKMRLSSLDIKSAKKQIAAATGQGLLNIDANGRYTRNLNLATNVLDFAGQEQKITLGTNNTLSASIDATFILFDGTYIVGVQAAKAYKHFVKLRHESTRNEIIDAVTQSYYGLIAAEKNLDFLRKSKENTDQIVSDMEKMYQVGYIEETDLDLVKINQLQVDNNIYALEQQQKTLEQMLCYQLGFSLDTKIQTVDEFEKWIQINPEYLQKIRAEYDYKKDLRYQISLENTNLLYKQTLLTYFKMLPSIVAFGSWGFNSNANDFNFNKGKSFPSAVGVTVRMPLFSSFSRMSYGQKDKVAWEKSKIEAENTGIELRLEMEKLRAEYYANFANYQSKKENLHLNEKIYKNATIKIKNAKMSSYDFAQMQLKYIQAQADHIGAMVDLLNTQSRLQKVLNNQTQL